VPEARLAPPVGDPTRGRYLQWLFFSGGCIEPAYLQKFTKLEVSGSSAGWGSFERVIDVLAEALAERPWILGERFSAADVMIGADLNYGVNIFKIVEPRPAFDAYIARCTARPAFRRATDIDQAGA
jgi:glutathione S-transferase